MNAIVPQPRQPISIRIATVADVPFVDALQKKNTKQVGWFATRTIEGKIGAGHVIVAEEGSGFRGQGSGNASPSLNPEPRTLNPLGYLIGSDRYFKRDDVGVIYQINVVDGARRGLVGAALLKAQFDRSAYGCKLYCCWCAQDLEANRFWEACGFVPLAFRAGSEAKRRVHIFWSKRIRAGDTTTPWWFPSQTSGGAMMEDRLVFPIPPGTHWSDAKPIVLPKDTVTKQLEDRGARKAKAPAPPIVKRQPLCGGLTFASPVVEKPKREKRAKVKNDPKFVSAARELRDRYLEHVNEDPSALPAVAGKYDINRGAALAYVAPPAIAGTGRLISAA